MSPTVGRIVLYKLTAGDAQSIIQQRTLNPHLQGNVACLGDEYPALVVRVFGGSEPGLCNLQVLLDGNDSYWATSRPNADSQYVRDAQAQHDYRDGRGCWRWPVPPPKSNIVLHTAAI